MPRIDRSISLLVPTYLEDERRMCIWAKGSERERREEQEKEGAADDDGGSGGDAEATFTFSKAN